MGDITFSFRGRCLFQMCIQKKPPSYAIKVLVLVDARKSHNGSGDHEQNSNEKIRNTNPGGFETCGSNYQN